MEMGGDKRDGRKPDQQSGGKGGNGRDKWETAVDEIGKETSDRVTRQQTCCCREWNISVLLVPSTAAAADLNAVFLCSLLPLALDTPVILFR